jgi:hypothetical protein
VYHRILKRNDNHYPAGTPGGKGGEFAPKLGPKPKFEDYYTGTGKYGDIGEKDYKEMEAYRSAEKVWQSKMTLAVSRGEVSPSEAYVAGWAYDEMGARDIKHVGELPQELYHVTTARNSVLALGLKTRDELSQFSGKGLGGGTSNTISFTTNKKIARDIYRAMKIAHRFLNDKISVDTLEDAAHTGAGANKPWSANELSSYPENSSMVDKIRTGVVIERGEFGKPPRDYKLYSTERLPDDVWEPFGYISGYEGKEMMRTYRRKLSPEEVDHYKMQYLKRWLAFREAAGGPSDPLFIFNDTAGFKKIPESDISMLMYKPKPKAVGAKVSGMDEWRVSTGDIVLLDKIIKDDALPWQ